MLEPSFNETLQIGIVVRDLETAMRRYVDDYGIGPWDIHEFTAGNAEDLHEHGRPSSALGGLRPPWSSGCSGS
jgi:methylmalonyl-CoA/ethylmalonyl-CoA epimerase